MGRRLPRPPPRRGLRDHRADPAGRSGLEPACRRLRRHHPVPDRQLLVHGGQRPRQTTGLPALHRRRRRLPRRPATRSSTADYLGFTLAGPRLALQRRGGPSPAARRGRWCSSHGGDGAAPARVDAGRGRPGFMAATAAERPPGPDVGEIVDGVLPGPAGTLDYRLYRPARPAPTRLSPTSTGAAGCSAVRTPTTPSAATCAPAPTPHRVGELPARPRGPVPRRRRRRLRRRALDRRPRRRAGWDPGQLAVAGWSAGGNVAAVPASWPATQVDRRSSASCC